MSESSGDPNGGGNDTSVPPSSHQDNGGVSGVTPPTSQPTDSAAHDGGHCGPLLDLGGLGSLISGLIDVDVGAGRDGSTHAAALIDVDLGCADVASVGVLGGVNVIGGAGILGGLDNLGTSCLLDGLLCDGILS
jgi:hypothetical protein